MVYTRILMMSSDSTIQGKNELIINIVQSKHFNDQFFVQHVHTACPKERPNDDRTMIPLSSSDHQAVTRGRMKISRCPFGHPQASLRRPVGEQPVSARPAAVFSSLLHPKIRTMAHGPPSRGRQPSCGRPTNE